MSTLSRCYSLPSLRMRRCSEPRQAEHRGLDVCRFHRHWAPMTNIIALVCRSWITFSISTRLILSTINPNVHRTGEHTKWMNEQVQNCAQINRIAFVSYFSQCTHNSLTMHRAVHVQNMSAGAGAAKAFRVYFDIILGRVLSFTHCHTSQVIYSMKVLGCV